MLALRMHNSWQEHMQAKQERIQILSSSWLSVIISPSTRL